MEKTRCQSCFREFEGAVCPHCGGAQNEEHQLPVGTMLHGRYQIGRVLGQGGFGITYIGWDRLMRTTVAIKEFFPSTTVFRKNKLSTSVECINKAMVPHYDYSKERFLREAEALVKFQDLPEVVNILDFSEENNTTYIVMEFVRGVNLAKYIRLNGGKLNVEETFRILKPLMEALAKVHKGGIIHRDISPDNIILDPMGGAKLLDFGAVRVVGNPDIEELPSKSTEAILKHGFTPIEQYNTRGNLGPWTDEYAMCATVFYCLTGRIPEDASIRMSEGIDPDWSAIEGLPEHQRLALEKGISCRAKDRFRSMDELLEALFPKAEKETPVEGFTVVAPQKVEKENNLNITPKEKKSSGSKKPLVFVAVAAAVLILIASFVLLPEKQENPSPAQLQGSPGTLPIEFPGHTEPNTPEIVPTTEATEPPTEPLSEEELAYQNAETLFAEGKLGEAAIAFGKLADYSDARERSFEIWDRIAFRDTISAGYYHTVGLKVDGTVLSVVSKNNNFGQANVSSWSDIIALSAEKSYTLGLKNDGTVVVVGFSTHLDDWSNIVSIDAGGGYAVGLKMDGTVITSGDNSKGQCDVESWENIVAVSAGITHTVGLTAEGTVVATGQNGNGQCNVADWTDIIAISAGDYHTVGLKADGTVVCTGSNLYGQCNISDWTDIIAISAGVWHTVGLKSDGTAVAAGLNYGQCYVSEWSEIAAISTSKYSIGLKLDGTVVTAGSDYYVGNWTDILVPNKRVPFR